MQISRHVVATVLALAASGSHAEGWSLMPVTDAGFKAEPTLAVMGGILNPEVTGADSDTAFGAELSFNCIALQPPSGKIRTQISWTRYDDSGLEINSVELNPHYVWKIGKNLEMGVGPGIGHVSGKAGALDDSVWAMQAGASLHYRSGNMFLGAEARYQFTEDDFGGNDLNNYRVMLKVGYNF
jgi:hypothetical protein